ncbi:MAG: ATP-grasp domain-containing protein [Planctomycetota bacterium]
MSERLLIAGGSVRAAAMSARRAGFEPLAIDRFADADLRRVCPTFKRYDDLYQLPMLGRQLPAADWMYTGPLENHPLQIEQFGKRRKLLGNEGPALRQLRDPWCLAAALAESGLPSPELSDAGQVPAGNDWLKKPLRAAGGFGIERFGLAHTGRGGDDRSIYFQKFISGASIGATFLGAGGRAVLVGVTEQLLGPDWGGSREFQYVGSFGPVVLPPEQTQALTRVGDCIADRFPVQGLFGVDAIVNADGVWPVEVNPRYTASVEIIERALNVATIRWHVTACRSGELPDVSRQDARDDRFDKYAKAVVYADREVFVDAKLERVLCEQNCANAEPVIADIPVTGTSIQRGEPIVTVFAKGATRAEVTAGLRGAIADVKRLTRDV